MERVLIVGNGYAGSRAAERLEGLGRFDVVRVSDEEHPAYCRHLLPGLPAGENGGPSGKIRSGAAVARFLPDMRKALLANGEEIPYDKALIATGARVFVPGKLRAMFGRLGNVRSMRRMEDALTLRRALGNS